MNTTAIVNAILDLIAKLAGLPSSTGQKTASGSTSVVQASLSAIALNSPPASLTANTDTTFTFASQVKSVEIQNNSNTAVGFEYDAAASAGSWQIPPNGGAVIFDHNVTAIHLYSSAATPVNGTAGSNIVLKGWA